MSAKNYDDAEGYGLDYRVCLTPICSFTECVVWAKRQNNKSLNNLFLQQIHNPACDIGRKVWPVTHTIVLW